MMRRRGMESNAGFIHKLKICLKELRETMVCLMRYASYYKTFKWLKQIENGNTYFYCNNLDNYYFDY